jgi:geranylgeranyl transferase type-2 subunit beta
MSKTEEKKVEDEAKTQPEIQNSESKSNEKEIQFYFEKHLNYLTNLDKTRDKYSIGFFTNEHLKVPALFWGVGALNLINSIDKHDTEKTVQFLNQCYNPDGGYGGSIGQDSHITSTHYGLLVLIQLNRLDTALVHREQISKYIKSLQNKDGSFKGDTYAETDSRFSYNAVSILKILGYNPEDIIDLKKATEYVLSCQNFDGGFGSIPGAESHGAYCFCCIGFLSVTGQLNLLDKVQTGKWLAERQTHLGGFNGRPEKLPDVCYSWWVLSSMFMIGTESFFDKDLLIKFILECQDDELGGIGDRPGNCHDVFHTFFGFCGLSLLKYGNLKMIDPTYAIPKEDVDRLFGNKKEEK